MIQYILESIAFQLLFLIIYDLFLKRETFFQWNRAYLIGTYVLSMLLPWAKIEAMKTTIPETFITYPAFLWSKNNATVVLSNIKDTPFYISWEYVVLLGGMLLATLFFGHKLYQIYRLRQKGEIQYFKDFTQVIIRNSSIAFSFFKSIFLGDKVIEKEHRNIVQHELVHIRQKHSYDLLFFELMRIVAWFNPLVYVYQNRISELHEFIADAYVAKNNKKEQYEFLLSQVFQTQNISFVNQFAVKSLIKKRIVMLQKSRSRKIWRFKYLAILPLVVGMLFYTSCELDEKTAPEDKGQTIKVMDMNQLTTAEELKINETLKTLSSGQQEWELRVVDKAGDEVKFVNDNTPGNYISGFFGERIKAKMVINSKISAEDFFGANAMVVPFSVVEHVPVFPGCENVEDKRSCFQKMMQKHISKNFRYPEEAQKLGIEGRVSVMFIVAKDGSIQGLRKRGPDKLLEDEAERIIRKLPKMVPGQKEGKNVSVAYSIPISFKLN
ncbi:TonB family protein [Maribacter sp. 2210JD10-5]|uniref:TonB family protein n=1 Tax=Maribacter sp. 2210JD10-5 TaxID=3386272 RepID=UPI0039BC7E2A